MSDQTLDPKYYGVLGPIVRVVGLTRYRNLQVSVCMRGSCLRTAKDSCNQAVDGIGLGLGCDRQT
jgi:hypothetical protein